MAKPIAIDLFAGAGGLSEGFRQGGVTVAASVERDAHAAETQRRNHTYRKRIRTEVINEDVQAVPAERLRVAIARLGHTIPDVIMGGPPCQGFSRSNMYTRDLVNPLNRLYKDFLRVVSQLYPTVVVIENVADLVKFAQGKIDKQIITGLQELGYEVQREILNAVDYGVPQKRKRVFFIGSRLRRRFAFPNPTVDGRKITVWEAISDLPSLPNGHSIDELPYGTPKPMSAYQRKMRRGSGRTIQGNLVTKNSELVVQRYRHIPQGGNWRYIPDELMYNYANKDRCHEWIYLRLREDKPAVTIINFRKSMLIHPREDRGLSVREAARLQSFPDHFIFCGSIGFQQQQVADAVPPLLSRGIALAIRRHLGM